MTVNLAAPPARFTEAEAKERMDFALAALAVAGHEIIDPVALDILERNARGELCGDEAREALRRHIQG
ncbi:antitoxin VbhA family protein [Actinomyces mediterranea]|uniref:antitoxin VbhA family protein n=1 Tax=Actinomyces mediterranea TaxID=1871028 RepID=UPI0009714A79|nr:antitoxin VbhA family protein [Actinomyces mediterranea]